MVDAGWEQYMDEAQGRHPPTKVMESPAISSLLPVSALCVVCSYICC